MGARQEAAISPRVTSCIGLGVALTAATALGQPVTTVLTHGYSLNGEKGLWVEGMAQAILARAGGRGAICRLDQATGAWELIGGTLGSGDPVVLIFTWLDDFQKTGPDWGFAEGAADDLHAALRDPAFAQAGRPLPPIDLLGGRDLHFLGHSRGTCVNSEAVERLALSGIAVDQVTTMDPHPVNGTLDAPFFDLDWGDPVPQKWSNTAWADNYWRADGGGFINSFDFDGIPLPATENVQLSESALECCAYGFSHSDVHLWYHGTIDTSANPCDGEQCITNTMRQTWWPEGYTERGYFYSIAGGGAAQRPAQPAGAAPGPVPSLYGGAFASASYAGWLYHGGAVNGLIQSAQGATYLRLGAGAGPSARHNRFLLPADARSVSFDYRIVTPDAAGDDRLVLRLTDRDASDYPVGSALDLFPSATGWVAGQTAVIPAAVPRGVAHTLTFEVDAGASAGAVIDIDNVEIATGPAGDVDGDGTVGVSDLLLLLGAWGRCPDPPAPCPADLNGDGTVGVTDLLGLLSGWSI